MEVALEVCGYVELLEFPGIPYRIVRIDQNGKIFLTGFIKSLFPSEVRSIPELSNS